MALAVADEVEIALQVELRGAQLDQAAAPEGFAQPALTALMSKDAPPDAQGELQGGIASAQNLALLVGTVMFAQIFGYFLQDGSPIQSPNVAYFISAALGLMALSVFIHVTRRRSA